jgi:hypothetical protein
LGSKRRDLAAAIVEEFEFHARPGAGRKMPCRDFHCINLRSSKNPSQLSNWLRIVKIHQIQGPASLCSQATRVVDVVLVTSAL